MNTGRRVVAWMAFAALAIAGCARGPVLVAPEARKTIDRKFVEYPNGFVLKTAARGLTAPSAITFVNEAGDYQGSMLVAETGTNGLPRIYGWKPDGAFFNVFPRTRPIPPLGLLPRSQEIYGPIGGMVFSQGRIYVTHRDANARGVITSFGFDGSVDTVVADMPAQGDYGMTDIAVHPTSGRLYFGLGAATNSGVVGLDNWQVGWVSKHDDACDLSPVKLKLLGYKFFTKNPRAGLFGGDDNVGTAPFQPFGNSNQLRIPAAPNGKPTSAVYSISSSGGDLRVEAHGIRLPRGLAFNEFGNLFATNGGMELRGTRPVMDDTDALLKIIQGTWYGWPDFSADLVPISDERFQPSAELMVRTGYPELSFLIDHASSGLSSPVPYRDAVLFGVFESLSGASKMDFAPASGAFRDYRGNAIVALFGDRAPFATSGQRLRGFLGRKVVRVDPDAKRVEDFIRNTEGAPASAIKQSSEALERPVDVKFAPDGKLYILDYGQMEMRDGKEKIEPGSGRIFVLEPATESPK